MKIYEITSRISNEQEINRELLKLNEAASAMPLAGSVESGPGIFTRAGLFIIKAIRTATWFFLFKPFYTFYKDWSTASDNLKATGDQATYNQVIDSKLGILLSTLAAALATKMIFGSAGLFVAFIRFIPIIGPIIANIFALLSSSVQLAILAELSSQEGRTKLAELLTFHMIDGSSFNGVAALGHLGHEAAVHIADVITRNVEEVTGQKLSTDTKTDKPTDTPAGKTDNAADTKDDPSFMSDLFGANVPVKKETPLPNEYLGPNLQRNPVTGQVEVKPASK